MWIRVIPLALLCAVIAGCDRLALKPERDLPRIKAIDARFNAGDFDYAQREAGKYTEDFPECHLGWCLLGWTHAKLDDLDSATRCFDRSIQLNPRSDNAYVGLGAVRRKAGDLEGAREAYAEATRILPENAEAFSSLLVIEIMVKDYQKAVDYGEKAWALRQDHASIPANLAIAYHYLGDEDKKRFFYQKAKELHYHRLNLVDQVFDGIRVIEQP